jgi:hypothetical protein
MTTTPPEMIKVVLWGGPDDGRLCDVPAPDDASVDKPVRFAPHPSLGSFHPGTYTHDGAVDGHGRLVYRWDTWVTR